MGSALSFTVEWFPWCGLLIDTTNLQILVDNSRYKSMLHKYPIVFNIPLFLDIRDCLTISNSSIVPAHSLSIQLIQ